MRKKRFEFRPQKREMIFNPDDFEDERINHQILMEETDRIRLFTLGTYLSREDAKELGAYLQEWGSGL